MRAARSKTVATWLALTGGAFGLHRFYLHGRRDPWAWLHPWPTLAGLHGVWRVQMLGQDDRLSWLLLPLLGLMIAQAALCAIVYGLTPDERWAARHVPPGTPAQRTGWGPVLGVIAALMIGTAALMSAVAYGSQRFFEWQLEQERAQLAPDQSTSRARP
jgi:uncharacterized membrane protein